MPVLKVLVGMIASGKTTYARMEAARGAVIINDDALVTALHGGDYTGYDRTLKPLYKSTENHIAAVALALGWDVVVDRGLNVSRKSRQRWVGLAAAFEAEAQAVVFARQSAEQHARRRWHSDSRGHDLAHWVSAATRHAAEWQTPTTCEGFSMVTHSPWRDIE